jgi:plasmid stabilization system protein ParE
MILLSPDAVVDVERVRGFLEERNPDAAQRALATIWHALEKIQTFPDLSVPTADAEIRQIIVRFGRSAYIARYTVVPQSGDILVTRLWHGREMRE